MTQASSAIIVVIKPSMEYAKPVHDYSLGNVRYSAFSERLMGRQSNNP
jgi:hypothetical protein